MWNHSANTLTEQNTFINVDRAIAYGLIKWGLMWCWRSAQPGMDSTNHAAFCWVGVTSRTFTFAAGPRTLTTVTLVSSVTGTTTLSDNPARRSRRRWRRAGSVATNWTRPSTWVKMSSAAGGHMAITALTYK